MYEQYFRIITTYTTTNAESKSHTSVSAEGFADDILIVKTSAVGKTEFVITIDKTQYWNKKSFIPMSYMAFKTDSAVNPLFNDGESCMITTVSLEGEIQKNYFQNSTESLLYLVPS